MLPSFVPLPLSKSSSRRNPLPSSLVVVVTTVSVVVVTVFSVVSVLVVTELWVVIFEVRLVGGSLATEGVKVLGVVAVVTVEVDSADVVDNPFVVVLVVVEVAVLVLVVEDFVAVVAVVVVCATVGHGMVSCRCRRICSTVSILACSVEQFTLTMYPSSPATFSFAVATSALVPVSTTTRCIRFTQFELSSVSRSC